MASFAERRQAPPHPDRQVIDGALAALWWWSVQDPPRPTSSVTGGGAIAAVEQALGRLVGVRHVLALPNATFALRVAVLAAGIEPGDEVLVSGLDWPAGRAAVASCGALPVPVPVRSVDLTLDPAAAATLRTPRTRAVIASHLHGLVADVPALRRKLPGVTVVEDAAQALGSALGRVPAGALGDLAAFSLGPGKAASAGELGLLTVADRLTYLRAVRLSQHPVRQMLTGIEDPESANLAGRLAPLSAVLGAYRLAEWPALAERLTTAEVHLRRALRRKGARLLGTPGQRAQPGRVPLLLDGSDEADLAERAAGAIGPTWEVRWTTSGAVIDPDLPAPAARHARELLGQVRVAELSAVLAR